MDYKIGDIMLVDKKIYVITNINNIYVELREFKVQENKTMVFTGEVLTVSSARLQEKDIYKVKYRPGDMVKSRDGHIAMIDNISFYQSLQSPMYEYHYLGEEESYRISSKSYDAFNLQKFNFSEGDILKYNNDEVVLVDIKDNTARYKRLEALTELDYYHMDLRNSHIIHLGNINEYKFKIGDRVTYNSRLYTITGYKYLESSNVLAYTYSWKEEIDMGVIEKYGFYNKSSFEESAIPYTQTYKEGSILLVNDKAIVLDDISNNIVHYYLLDDYFDKHWAFMIDLNDANFKTLGHINDFKYKRGDRVMLADESIVTIENIYLGVDNEFRYSYHYVEGGLSFTCYASKLESNSSKIEPLDEPKEAFEHRFSIGDKLYHKGRLIEIIDIKPKDDKLYYYYHTIGAIDRIKVRAEVSNLDSWVKDKVILEYIPTGAKVEAELTSEGYIATLGSVPVNITKSNLLESFKEVRIEDLDLKYKPGDLVQDRETESIFIIKDVYYKAEWGVFAYKLEDIYSGYVHEQDIEYVDDTSLSVPSSICIDILEVSYPTKNLKDEEYVTNLKLDNKNINLTPNEVKALIGFLEQQLDIYNAINEEESDE